MLLLSHWFLDLLPYTRKILKDLICIPLIYKFQYTLLIGFFYQQVTAFFQIWIALGNDFHLIP